MIIINKMKKIFLFLFLFTNLTQAVESKVSSRVDISKLNIKKANLLLVIIDDGSDEQFTEFAIENLPPRTIIALPHNAKNLEIKAKKARARGLGVCLLMGLGGWGIEFGDPGEGALWPQLSNLENQNRIEIALSKIGPNTPIMLWGGGAFFNQPQRMTEIAKYIMRRNITVLDPCIIGFANFFHKNYIPANRTWGSNNQIQTLEEFFLESKLENRFFICGEGSIQLVKQIIQWVQKNGAFINMQTPQQFLATKSYISI
jgi:hypothetical protein